MVVELFPCLLVSSFLLFCFEVRALERSPDGARSGSESVCQPDQSEDAVGTELLVEPLSTEQTDQNAQRQFKADSSISADTFPVLLHKCSQWGRERRSLSMAFGWGSICRAKCVLSSRNAS